jgi:hypothetical protein
VCNVSFNFCVASYDVFCLRVMCYFVWYVYFCVLCLFSLSLPPGKSSFTVLLNNKINRIIIFAFQVHSLVIFLFYLHAPLVFYLFPPVILRRYPFSLDFVLELCRKHYLFSRSWICYASRLYYLFRISFSVQLVRFAVCHDPDNEGTFFFPYLLVGGSDTTLNTLRLKKSNDEWRRPK